MTPFAKKFFTVCIVLVLLITGGMQGRKLVRRSRAKRLTAEAVQHLDKNDLQAASSCLRAALQANSASIEAVNLMGDLLERAGSPNALSWRIRASQLQPGNMTNRLNWAQTAVRLGDWKSAEDALSSLDDDAKSSARYEKIAGALAWGEGKTDEAEQHYKEARRIEPENPSSLLNLGTIGLVSTNEAVAAEAKRTLEALSSTNGVYAMDALRRLAQIAAKHRDVSEALAYTERLTTNPSATFGDKLDYLNLLSVTKNTDTEPWLKTLKQQAKNSPVEAGALGRWLYRAEGPTNALTWLSSLPANLQTNQPVPLVITDCQTATKDWQGLLASVEKQDWGESEFFRISLESLARRSLGQQDEARWLWNRAQRQSARRLDRLYHLTQLTSAWGWAPERTEVLTEIVSEFPREKWATKLLIAQLCDEGETDQLEQLLTKLSAADPDNAGLKTSLARVLILRKNQLETAYRLAKEAYDKTPEDPVVLSTYAYSLSLQGKPDEALNTLRELKPESIQIPWVAACYGVIQAQSGNGKAAREPLERAQAARLLPEELDMVRHATATLNTAQF